MHSERGQAGIDYLAVLGVVAATLLAALAGALPGAAAVPRGVASAFERAFCLVAQGDCLDGRPRPCVLRTDARSRERRASIAVVRLGDGRTVTREDRSDGTVVVTVEDGARIGGALTLGGEVTIGGRGVRAKAELGLDGRGARGRRYVLPDGAAADRLLARLAGEHTGAAGLIEGGGDGLPEPDERWWALGKGGEAEASLRALGFGARASLVRSTVAGVRERRTGERTIVLRADAELTAALTAPMSRLGVGGTGANVVELAFDARHRPVSLTVKGARGVHGVATVGPFVSRGGGDLLEYEARLDLADPAVREHADDLVDAVRSVAPGRAVRAARGLGERLVDRARVDVRLYDTDRSVRITGGTIGILGTIGVEIEDVRRTGRLVDAAGREPGMGWARRLDCLGVTA